RELFLISYPHSRNCCHGGHNSHISKKEGRIQLVINISSNYENTIINDFSNYERPILTSTTLHPLPSSKTTVGFKSSSFIEENLWQAVILFVCILPTF
ncbi:MAG: hypothetical protein ACXWFZ_09520, partial [Nitrososphaeraceae archaeon]